jgi:hypothetical protein
MIHTEANLALAKLLGISLDVSIHVETEVKLARMYDALHNTSHFYGKGGYLNSLKDKLVMLTTTHWPDPDSYSLQESIRRAQAGLEYIKSRE